MTLSYVFLFGLRIGLRGGVWGRLLTDGFSSCLSLISLRTEIVLVCSSVKPKKFSRLSLESSFNTFFSSFRLGLTTAVFLRASVRSFFVPSYSSMNLNRFLLESCRENKVVNKSYFF